jgi:hypothetical protein
MIVTLVFKKNANFFLPKLAKIAKNADRFNRGYQKKFLRFPSPATKICKPFFSERFSISRQSSELDQVN